MPRPRFRRRRSATEPGADASAPAASGTVADAGEPTRDTTVSDELAAEDEALLTTPLDDTDLDERLVAASGSGRARSTTVLLVVAVFVVGLVVGGAAGTSAVELREAIATQMGEEEDVVPPPAALVDGRLHGTIRVVDGTTVLVDAPDGTTVLVETAATTRVATTTPADLDDLRPGAGVHVTGEASTRGTVVATKIVDLGQR
jgi:hypothetical protein